MNFEPLLPQLGKDQLGITKDDDDDGSDGDDDGCDFDDTQVYNDLSWSFIGFG